jgi:hypothetical protein
VYFARMCPMVFKGDSVYVKTRSLIHATETFRVQSPLNPLFTHALPLRDHCTDCDAHFITS